MNLQHLNLDLYGVHEDEDTQIIIFLIAAELKSKKLINTLIDIGCDACFCVPDMCDLVLALIGFNDRPNELYDYYFELLDHYCDKVTYENNLPIREAIVIYNQLKEKVPFWQLKRNAV